jgi:hypothetical protein
VSCAVGPGLVELADRGITEMADQYAATYPSAIKRLLADRKGSLPTCVLR